MRWLTLPSNEEHAQHSQRRYGVSGWKKDYKKKSELAEKVYYQDVRAALMGVILGAMGGRVDAMCADGKTKTYK